MGFIKKLLRYKLQKDFGGIYVPDVKSRIKKIKLYTISDIEHQWNSVTLSQRNWRDRYEWKTDIDFFFDVSGIYELNNAAIILIVSTRL